VDAFASDPRDHSPEEAAGRPPATGRRAAHRQATAAAIQTAADRLVAERGFAATTVREIAAAAGVTERTFYRYYDGKDGIVASKLGRWMQAAQAAIIARPQTEGPVLAVRMALVELAHAIEQSPQRELLWAFTDNPSALASMRRSGERPLVRIEQLITEALLERARTGDQPDPRSAPASDRFACELVARTAVAALRTVGAERRRSRADGATHKPEAMIAEAFDTLQRLFSTVAQ
jgi:AcrR family transcriptional regulator